MVDPGVMPGTGIHTRRRCTPWHGAQFFDHTRFGLSSKCSNGFTQSSHPAPWKIPAGRLCLALHSLKTCCRNSPVIDDVPRQLMDSSARPFFTGRRGRRPACGVKTAPARLHNASHLRGRHSLFSRFHSRQGGRPAVMQQGLPNARPYKSSENRWGRRSRSGRSAPAAGLRRPAPHGRAPAGPRGAPVPAH